MKKFLVAACSALFLLAGCAGTEIPPEVFDVFAHDELKDKELTAENEFLSLRFDCETTAVEVTDKRTGKVWTSNPADAANDPLAVNAIKQKLASQLLVSYGEETGVVTEINNNTLSVAGGAYTWQQVENGVKVSYTMGEADPVYLIPEAVAESRFNSFYDQMDSAAQRALNNYYRTIDINNLRADEDANALLEQYPQLATERMFMLREGMQANLLQRLEGYFAGVGYTPEDFAADRAAAAEGEAEATPIFNISVIYQLDGEDFVVSVPLDEIEFRYDYPLLSFSVLPYFGAGGTADEGFMFVPDASGAVINFNNGKQNQQAYINSVYGYDYALKRTALITDNAAPFPVFGITNNDGQFICVIEEGAENSSVEADVSGRVNSYNYAASRYTLSKWDDIDIAKANVYAKVTDRAEHTGVFSQRYIFANTTDYVSMAATYRGYLTAQYPQLQKTDEAGLPAVLGIIGAIDRGTNIMGFPVIRPYALTTYDEAAGMIESFKNAGVGNLRANYTGWFNSSVVHDAPDNIKLIGALGGKNDFESLLSTAESQGTPLFVEADFTFVMDGGLFDGYSVNRDTAKRLSRDLVELYPYSIERFREIDEGAYSNRYGYYLANPDYTFKAIDSFYNALTDLGGNNITFGSIGRSINSDFDVRQPVSTKDAAAMQQQKLKELKDKGTGIMLHSGFDYAAPYADFILDMALESKNYNILDESIPFYEIALHGLVPYAGAPVNLATDYEYAILKTVETGAGLQFQFMSATGEEIQDTNYTRYYGSDIARWGDKPAELYHKLNSELGHTVNLLITGHEKLAEQVYKTTYEDGTQVIVNYAAEPFAYEGTEVNGTDFTVARP